MADGRYRMLSAITGDAALASAVDVEVGWAKANCLTPTSYGDAAELAGRPAVISVDQVVEVFEVYEATLQRTNNLDLDDVLLRSADLIHDDAEFAERVRWRYRHLSVDEFQDVNPAQFRLILALLGAEQDLCAVGDPNQAIYGWNGADPRLLDELHLHLPGLEVVHLDENHRSTPQIVAAASAALGPSLTSLPRSTAPAGAMPVVTAYEDDVAEAEGVVALLSERSAEGLAWSDQAVLARTNDQLIAVRRELARAGIPVPDGSRPPGWRRRGLDRSRRGHLGDVPSIEGPRVELGRGCRDRGWLRADHLRRVRRRSGGGAAAALCRADPRVT